MSKTTVKTFINADTAEHLQNLLNTTPRTDTVTREINHILNEFANKILELYGLYTNKPDFVEFVDNGTIGNNAEYDDTLQKVTIYGQSERHWTYALCLLLVIHETTHAAQAFMYNNKVEPNEPRRESDLPDIRDIKLINSNTYHLSAKIQSDEMMKNSDMRKLILNDYHYYSRDFEVYNVNLAELHANLAAAKLFPQIYDTHVLSDANKYAYFTYLSATRNQCNAISQNKNLKSIRKQIRRSHPLQAIFKKEARMFANTQALPLMKQELRQVDNFLESELYAVAQIVTTEQHQQQAEAKQKEQEALDNIYDILRRDILHQLPHSICRRDIDGLILYSAYSTFEDMASGISHIINAGSQVYENLYVDINNKQIYKDENGLIPLIKMNSNEPIIAEQDNIKPVSIDEPEERE